MAAVMLPPGQLAADEGIDRRHLVSQVIAGSAEVLLAEQPVSEANARALATCHHCHLQY
jgi:hypothetical protein